MIRYIKKVRKSYLPCTGTYFTALLFFRLLTKINLYTTVDVMLRWKVCLKHVCNFEKSIIRKGKLYVICLLFMRWKRKTNLRTNLLANDVTSDDPTEKKTYMKMLHPWSQLYARQYDLNRSRNYWAFPTSPIIGVAQQSYLY